MIYRELADGSIISYAVEEQGKQEESIPAPSLQTASKTAKLSNVVVEAKINLTKEVTDGKV